MEVYTHLDDTAAMSRGMRHTHRPYDMTVTALFGLMPQPAYAITRAEAD